jgi:hypothetical protein
VVYIATFDSLKPTDFKAVTAGQKTLVIDGMVDYCDTFGTYHCQMFWAKYIDGSFVLTIGPPDCPRYSDMIGAVTKNMPPGSELLTPCETDQELKENDNEDMKEQVRKVNSIPGAVPASHP